MALPLLTVTRHWKLIGVGLLVVLLALQSFRVNSERKVKVKAQEAQVASEQARAEDRANYRNAQVAAAKMNDAQVATIEAKQEKISAEQKSNFDRDLARLRAGGVRQDLAAVSRPAGRAKAGSVPAPTCQSDDANVCVDRKVIVQAAEIELGRNALIDWINRQIEVPR